MALYRHIVGWTVRVVLFPVMVLAFVCWVLLTIMDYMARGGLYCAERLENWELGTPPPEDEWRVAKDQGEPADQEFHFGGDH